MKIASPQLIFLPANLAALISLCLCFLTCTPLPIYEPGGRASPVASFFAATVKIESEDSVSRTRGLGALIDPKGLVITCLHNVKGTNTSKVTLSNGTSYFANMIKVDEKNDLAILQISGAPGNLPFFRPAAGSPKIGMVLFAAGVDCDRHLAVLCGPVSSLDRTIEVPEWPNPRGEMIATGIALRAGCSGGPLLNSAGELVGINLAVSTSQAEAFSLPVRAVRDLMRLPDPDAGGESPGRPAIPVAARPR